MNKVTNLLAVKRISLLTESTMDCQVMVVSCKHDLEALKQTVRIIEAAGLNVWPKEHMCEWSLDTPAAAPKAIETCQFFIPLMSEHAIHEVDFQDCLSLAYVTNKEIIPVGLQRVRYMRPDMNAGMKLILLMINWHFADNEDTMEESILELAKRIRDELGMRRASQVEVQPQPQGEHSVHGAAAIRNRMMTGYLPGQRRLSATADEIKAQLGFWLRNFEDKTEVPWSRFREAFLEEFHERIEHDFSDDRTPWLLNTILLQEIIGKDTNSADGGNPMVAQDRINAFLGTDDIGNILYHRVQEYAAGSLAIKNIFSMNSNMRLTVIKNMGKFNTPYVLGQLEEMLADEEPNIRAVAAIALGQCSTTAQEEDLTRAVTRLVQILKDPTLSRDRLVRESLVLALGKLRATSAVPFLAHLWRNDAIRDVREAAEVALRKIGGPEVEDAMRVTKTLFQEMENLRKQRKPSTSK